MLPANSHSGVVVSRPICAQVNPDSFSDGNVRTSVLIGKTTDRLIAYRLIAYVKSLFVILPVEELRIGVPTTR